MTIKVSEKIQNNLVNLRQQLKILGEESNDKQPVELLAVSKRHSIDAIKAAAEADQVHFGENYVQEGVEKIQQLQAKLMITVALRWSEQSIKRKTLLNILTGTKH